MRQLLGSLSRFCRISHPLCPTGSIWEGRGDASRCGAGSSNMGRDSPSIPVLPTCGFLMWGRESGAGASADLSLGVAKRQVPEQAAWELP